MPIPKGDPSAATGQIDRQLFGLAGLDIKWNLGCLRCCGFELGPSDDPSAIGSIGGCRAAVTVWVSDLPALHWSPASKMIVWPGSSPSVAARAAFASWLAAGGTVRSRLVSVTPTCLRRASKFARLRSWGAVRAERGGSSDVRRCLVAGERRGLRVLAVRPGFQSAAEVSGLQSSR